MFESRKRHHLFRAALALTPGRDKPEGASAWELRGYAVGSPLGRFRIFWAFKKVRFDEYANYHPLGAACASGSEAKSLSLQDGYGHLPTRSV